MVTSDNCFEFKVFCKWWDQIEANYDLPGVPDTGWMLDTLVELFNEQGPVDPAAAAAVIWDGYDPTPDTPYDWFH
jgi:hypothetical protein